MTESAYDFLEKSIPEIQAAMADGLLSSRALVEAFLARIDAYDQRGPKLNTMVYVNRNAPYQAQSLDEERARQGPRGPLHGIPVIIKDNYDTFDMPTTAASLSLMGSVPPDDAYQVRKLREAGCVILGKSNLHEFARGGLTVSSLGGQTRNAYDPERSPSGSSGGSAAAVAANFATFATGSDTFGSIRIPAAYNSLVGLKPTYGLASTDGVVPLRGTQDTAGPIVRSVTDLAIVLDLTVGVDANDPRTFVAAGHVPPTYTAFLDPEGLRGARIGLVRVLFGEPPESAEVVSIIETAAREMKRLGATVVEVEIPNLLEIMAAARFGDEFKHYLNAYLKATPSAPVRSLTAILESGLYHVAALPTLEDSDRLPRLDEDAFRETFTRRIAQQQAILAAMDAAAVEALFYPTSRHAPPRLTEADPPGNPGFASQSFIPALTVPGGFTADGLPVGLELAGRPWSEPALLRLGYAFEHATRHHRPPLTTPALDAGASPDSNAVSEAVTPAWDGSTFEVEVRGENAVAPSLTAQFSARARFSFAAEAASLSYEVTVSGVGPEGIAGAYLHRRSVRQSGPVTHILAKGGFLHASGRINLSEPDVDALHAGDLYISVLSSINPLVSARGALALRQEE